MRDKLSNMLVYAYKNVPFYKHLYEEKNINISNIDDFLFKLPIAKKEMIINSEYSNLSKEFLTQYYGNELILMNTSGSTGQCLDVYWEMNDYKRSLFPLWIKRSIKTSDKLCLFFANQYYENKIIEDVGDIIYSKNIMMVNKNNWNQSKLRSICEKIAEFSPEWMILQPSIAVLLCHCINNNNIKLDKIKYIECTGEVLLDSVKKLIKDTFKCDVRNQYGCSEVNSIAYECRCGNLHILEEVNFVEILKNGQKVPNGQEGHIYVTSLQNRAMPFIRYETGDTGIMYNSDYCKCGDKHKVLKLTNGRKTDLIDLPSGETVNAYIFVSVIERMNQYLDGCIKQFQIIQESYNIFVVKLIVDEDYKKSIDLLKQIFISLIQQDSLFKTMPEFIFEIYEDLFLGENGKLSYFINNVFNSSL